MNKQQKIFNILAKEQKPMKVEFALMDDANKLISAFKSIEGKIIGHIIEYGKAILVAENLYDQLLKDDELVKGYYRDIENTLRKFKQQVKEIGLEENSIPELHELQMLYRSVEVLLDRIEKTPKIKG